MIKTITIKNYKSVSDVQLDLSRINVLIGENGGGKSNLLEAISYGVAASLDKLDNEHLGLRGIRVAEPIFMTSAFEKKDEISISFLTDDADFSSFSYTISPLHSKIVSTIASNPKINMENSEMSVSFSLNKESEEKFKGGQYEELFADKIKEMLEKYGVKEPTIKINIDTDDSKPPYKNSEAFKYLNSFTLYCPEESALRTYRDDIQLLPLGRKGEGLFRYLKQVSNTDEGKKMIIQINQHLCLLDWFESVDMPADAMSNDYSIKIKDRYISETLESFDQRSTNEGFLYLLFYLTLFISKDTPRFFAIDNIESSFNPKLCTKIIKVLIQLAKENRKQVILTTHNPFILDGLDLSDDTQKLLVVKRNDEGRTKVKEIIHKPERKKKLSEIWMSGAIGGLPDNF